MTVTLPELGSDPWHFRPGAVDASGPARPAGARGRRRVGRGDRARAPASSQRCCAARRRCCCPAPASVVQALARRSRSWWSWRCCCRALHAAAAGPARLHRALVLHQRLDLPDRAGRRPAAARRQPLRPRLPPLGARALLHPRRHVSERVREREVALRHFAYFPGTVYVAAAWRLLPAPVRRLPAAHAALHPADASAALAFRAPLRCGWRWARC